MTEHLLWVYALGLWRCPLQNSSSRQYTSIPALYVLDPNSSRLCLHEPFTQRCFLALLSPGVCMGRARKNFTCRNISKKDPQAWIVHWKRSWCLPQPYAPLQWQSSLIPGYGELNQKPETQSSPYSSSSLNWRANDHPQIPSEVFGWQDVSRSKPETHLQRNARLSLKRHT